MDLRTIEPPEPQPPADALRAITEAIADEARQLQARRRADYVTKVAKAVAGGAMGRHVLTAAEVAGVDTAQLEQDAIYCEAVAEHCKRAATLPEARLSARAARLEADRLRREYEVAKAAYDAASDTLRSADAAVSVATTSVDWLTSATQSAPEWATAVINAVNLNIETL